MCWDEVREVVGVEHWCIMIIKALKCLVCVCLNWQHFYWFYWFTISVSSCYTCCVSWTAHFLTFISRLKHFFPNIVVFFLPSWILWNWHSEQLIRATSWLENLQFFNLFVLASVGLWGQKLQLGLKSLFGESQESAESWILRLRSSPSPKKVIIFCLLVVSLLLAQCAWLLLDLNQTAIVYRQQKHEHPTQFILTLTSRWETSHRSEFGYFYIYLNTEGAWTWGTLFAHWGVATFTWLKHLNTSFTAFTFKFILTNSWNISLNTVQSVWSSSTVPQQILSWDTLIFWWYELYFKFQ